jgi:hypothetical protein
MGYFDLSTIWQGRHILFVSGIIVMDRPFYPNDILVLLMNIRADELIMFCSTG